MTLLTQMYNYKYTDKETIVKVARTFLALPTDNDISYFQIKFLIAVDALVGLDNFSEKELRQLNYSKLRPLQLAMVLELFYGR